MPRTQVQATKEGGFLSAVPIDPDILEALANDMAPMRTVVGTRTEVLLELAGIKAAIRTWFDKQPDQVLREASAYSARCTELWTEVRLLEQHDRTYTQIRTMQIQPVLDEIDRQYKFNQSRIAIARQDIDLIRGT